MAKVEKHQIEYNQKTIGDKRKLIAKERYEINVV